MCRDYVMNYPALLHSDRWALRKAHAGMYGLFIDATSYFNTMYLTYAKETSVPR